MALTPTPDAGERELTHFRAHWHSLLFAAPVLAFAIAVEVLLVVTSASGTFAVAARLGVWGFALVFVGSLVARWISTVYLLTDRRIVRTCGIVRRQSFEIPLTEISSIQVSQTLVERVLGYGDILVETAGDTDGRLVDIPKPKAFRKLLADSRDRAAAPHLSAAQTPDETSPVRASDRSLCSLRPEHLNEAHPADRTQARWDTVARLGALVEAGVIDDALFDRALDDLLDDGPAGTPPALHTTPNGEAVGFGVPPEPVS